jgi:hypothetical protein
MDIWMILRNDDYGASRVLGFVYGSVAHSRLPNGLVIDSQSPNFNLEYECNKKAH